MHFNKIDVMDDVSGTFREIFDIQKKATRSAFFLVKLTDLKGLKYLMEHECAN